jgi:tRNA threonylcarbamoyladenosine biosynthesis protein TsaB
LPVATLFATGTAMKLLAIDTAARFCSACIRDADQGELSRRVLDLGKGHAEVLMDIVGETLGEAGIGYRDLDAVAVSVGPGSFTGVRVGVAAARGLALALSVPAIGVSTLHALALAAREEHPGRPVMAVIDAGRGEVYVAVEDEAGEPLGAPVSMPHAQAAALVRPGWVVTGSGVAALGDLPAGAVPAATGATADISIFARIGLATLAGGKPAEPPRPLYLRGADARPQAHFALPRRSGA